MEFFLETICLQGGRAQLLDLHRQRMQRTAQAHHFTAPLLPDIERAAPRTLTKCRIVYRESIREVTYLPYPKTAPIASWQLVSLPNGYDYRYKREDRTVLQQLKASATAQEIILVDNQGMITDCSFANLALWREGKWYTPSTPLLEGVKRAHLLQQGLLSAIPIHHTELPLFTHIVPINAMRNLPTEQELVSTILIENDDTDRR